MKNKNGESVEKIFEEVAMQGVAAVATGSESGRWSRDLPPPGTYQVRVHQPGTVEDNRPPGANWLTDHSDVTVTNDPEYPIKMNHFVAGRAYADNWRWWIPNDKLTEAAVSDSQ